MFRFFFFSKHKIFNEKGYDLLSKTITRFFSKEKSTDKNKNLLAYPNFIFPSKMSRKRKAIKEVDQPVEDDVSSKLKEFQFQSKKMKRTNLRSTQTSETALEKSVTINLQKGNSDILKLLSEEDPDKKLTESQLDEKDKEPKPLEMQESDINEQEEEKTENNELSEKRQTKKKEDKIQVVIKKSKTTIGTVKMVKKLNRNRSMMENLLDNYIPPDRLIELGDGKIEAKEILIGTWNVNGLNSLLKKDNLPKYMEERKPDILCLNETKLTDDNCLEIGTKWIPEGYYSYFNCCKIKKGYAGTAIVSKYKPLSITFDLGIKKHGLEGRTITAEFETFYLVSCYVPNAGENLVGLPYRSEEWDPDLRNYVNELKKKKNVILCGDLNCAHQEIDIYDPKGKDKSPCFTPQERKGFGELLDSGFVDTFRHFYPQEKKFSFFSVRFDSRGTYRGWRLDYVLVNKEGIKGVKDALIHDKVLGSDHVPVEIILDPKFGE